MSAKVDEMSSATALTFTRGEIKGSNAHFHISPMIQHKMVVENASRKMKKKGSKPNTQRNSFHESTPKHH